MSKRSWCVLGMVAILWSGCGGPDEPVEPPPPPPPPAVLEPPEPERSLAEQLERPRPDLAAACVAWTDKVQQQRTLYRRHELRFELLPDLRLPLAVPVWRQAAYSAKAGISLPPYLKEGARDTALALHLARFGDVEAARMLADPADRDALARIDGLRLGRNYPVEWTRLVGLMLYHAEFRLAVGRTEAAEDILKLHRELRHVLDAKAQRSALGAALLPRGWAALRQAAAVWRAGDKANLGKVTEAALADWGEAPPPAPALTPGTPRAEVAQVLGGRSEGRALLAPSVLRALDLLELPLPDDGADAVAACFDAADRLADVLIVYQTGLSEDYRRPEQLAHLLEGPSPGRPLPGALPRRLYRLAGAVCEVTMTPDHPSASGLVRIGGKAPVADAALPRDLGAVHLNRSFGQNRLQFVPHQQGKRLAVVDAGALARLQVPVPAADRGEAILRRDAEDDALADLTIRYKPEQRRWGLAKIALPLWQMAGAGRLTGSVKEGGELALVWEDPRTRYVLRMPQAAWTAPEVILVNRANGQGPGQRGAGARAWDRQERRERLKSGRPLALLPRALEGLKLGAPRAEVLSHLPGAGALRRDLADGVLVTVVGPGSAVREVLVRLDEAGKASDLRIHYADAGGQVARVARKLFASLEARAGVPDERKGKTARSLLWQDDRTTVVWGREGPGVDVTLRDRPPGQDEDAPRPRSYLPRGPEHCVLATSRGELQRHWGAAKPTAAGGPLVLTAKEAGPYDALLVWLEGDRVVRVVARHREPEVADMGAAQAGQAVREAWAREAAVLGWPRRQEVAAGGAVRSWAGHDDRTRVRIFWQQNPGEAPRVYTEWQDQGRP